MDREEFFKPCNEAYREAIAIHECLRTLGCLPDDIYFSCTRVFPTTVIYTILKQGEKECIFTCGTVSTKNEGVVFKKWTSMVSFWNSKILPQEDINRLIDKSYVSSHKAEFVIALTKKGFDVDRYKLN